MAAIFITATGTDIGKTFVTAGLIRHLRRNQQTVDALKPIVTGFDAAQPQGSDPAVLLDALGRPITTEELARISPWRFKAPLAPDMAGKREGRSIDFAAMVKHSHEAVRQHHGTLLIEGIGGIMVPLDDRHTVLDWMAALGAPVVLVAGSYLGTISHTLTCLAALRQRALSVRAVIVNETEGSTVGLADTVESVARFARPVPVVRLPRGDAGSDGYFEDIAELLR
jgi:dethiobiotin synthetase